MTKTEELARLQDGVGPLANTLPNEPIFFLCGRDRTASKTVRQWVQNAKDAGCQNEDKLTEALQLANEMDAWREGHRGGKVPD